MDNPSGRLVTYIYDCPGRLSASVDGQGTRHVINFDATGNPKGAVPLPRAASPVPTDPTGRTGRRIVHTFEFRLSGCEEATQSIALPHAPASDRLMAATQAVRIFVTRSPDRETASIGGVEVHAEVRGPQVICIARVTDFTADDLVVVQADVIVGSAQVLPEE